MNKGLPTLVNRRYLRIKVFQAIYAYQRTPEADLVKMEREMFESINRLYTLYLYLVKLLMQVGVVAEEISQQGMRKNLPTTEELNPNRRFIENRVFKQLKENVQLQKLMEKAKINWKDEHDDIRKIFKAFREDEQYKLYMIREDNNLQLDKEILVYLFREHLGVNDVVHSALEEKDIYWQDDLPIAALTVLKTIHAMPEGDTANSTVLADLYKDKKEDQSFAKELLRKTIQFAPEYAELIASKADNWESERIALLDLIMMQMGLAELEHFATIPVKVTLNEYIELAKSYSTPKSKVFINGVLDKLVLDMKKSERINKRGRGLLE
ncbi:MAG: transcription antitermination factor NusB [Cryomorphaceae bacterium]